MIVLKILLAFTFSLLLASSMAGHSNFIGVLPESVHAVTMNLTLEGWTGGWNSTLASGFCSPIGTPTCNPTIIVSQGDSVNLALPSGDSAPHQFFIDVDGNPPRPDCAQDKCSDMLPTAYPFIVDLAPGTYKYYCTFHQGPMQGDFVVQGFTITSIPSSLRVVQGFSNTSTIAVTSINNFVGVVDLSATALPVGATAVLNPTSVALSPGGAETSSLTISASGTTPVGNYNVNVAGMSGSVSSIRIVPTLVVPPDFGISGDPTRLVIPLGSARNSTIILTSVDSFFGDVALSLDLLPAGMTATLTPTSVTVPSGGRANSTLDVSVSPTFTTPGSYMVNVTGTSGSLTHTATVTVVAGPDFDISASPAILPLIPGSSGASTITVTSFNEFSGIVDLTGFPSNGPAFSINPPSVTLAVGGTAASELVVNTSTIIGADNYTLTVTGTSGSNVHSAVVTISVMDFSLAVSNSNLTVQRGSSTTATVSITSLNRFAGVVSLATSVSSSALSSLLNVTTLSLSPSGTGFAVLTINASSVQPGTYTVSIIGTSGSLSRAASLSITVQPSTGGASILPLVGGAVVAGIAVASAVLYYTRRRRVGGKTAGGQVPT